MSSALTIVEEYQKILKFLDELMLLADKLAKLSRKIPSEEPKEPANELKSLEVSLREFSSMFGSYSSSAERQFTELLKKYPSLKQNKTHPIYILLEVKEICTKISKLCITGKIYSYAGSVLSSIENLKKEIMNLSSRIEKL